jgi:hypothetical protein
MYNAAKDCKRLYVVLRDWTFNLDNEHAKVHKFILFFVFCTL